MDSKRRNTVSIILGVLLIAAATGNGFLIVNNREAVWNVIAVTELLALLSGIVYVYENCIREKDDCFFTVSVVLQTLVYFMLISMVPNERYGIMIMLVKFGCLCLLSFAGNLEKKKAL